MNPSNSKLKSAQYNTIADVPLKEAFIRNSIGNELNNSRVYARSISSGTLRGEQQIGDKNIKLDSSNRRILIYDEDGNARVLIGFDEDGF